MRWFVRLAPAGVLALASLAVGCADSPAAGHGTAPAAPARAPVQATADTPPSGPGTWFVDTGCSRCHAVSVYGVKGDAPIGPDLSIAAEDVKTRFGVNLEEFFETPQGTMALVLSSQIRLTPEQKKDVVRRLEVAFEDYQRQQKPTGD